MNKPASSTRWFASWRAAEPAPDDDPADLGTAFGLDMSLLQTDPAPLEPMPGQRETGRVERVVDRRKPD